MKAVLHIGTEKTGTTLLQNWLYANRANLYQKGIYLSENLGKPNNRYIPSYFRSELDDWAKANNIRTLEEKGVFFRNFLIKLSDEIREASKNCDIFLITSEHFHSRLTEREDIESLKNYISRNFDGVKIICYFRNQFDVAVSAYSTSIKTGLSSDLNAFLDKADINSYYYNYLKIANVWSGAFGKENCEFRIYDRNAFKYNDIRKDFIDAIDSNIAFEGLDYSIVVANEALSLLEAIAYIQINKAIPYWDNENGGINVENIRARYFLSNVNELKRGVIRSNRREEIERRFEGINEEFFDVYFHCGNRFISSGSGVVETEEEISLSDVAELIGKIVEAALQMSGSVNLYDSDADYLRDIANRIAGKSESDLEDALRLMKLAKRARPNGPYIARKVDEWTERLKKLRL